MTTEDINSCFMLAVNLDLPVDLGCIFDSSDVTELELDSHITILYAKNQIINRDTLGLDTKIILEPEQIETLTDFKTSFDILDMCDLGVFENSDKDYIVLKLKDSTVQSQYCSLLNKALSRKYDVKSDFSKYNPHITLATLVKGTGKKYLKSETLNMALNYGTLSFEDLLVSHGKEDEEYKHYYITSKSCVQRYFRLANIIKRNKELEKE